MSFRIGPALAASGGALLLYSGVTGKDWSKTLANLITTGKPGNTEDYALTAVTNTGGSGSYGYGSGSATGLELAVTEAHYAGHSYVYGGAPGVNAQSGWDCSSMQNYCIGYLYQMGIPGVTAGGYNGTSHGPNTISWLAWSGCETISQSEAQPGDLAVWETHMGMFVDGGNNIISALNPQLGTLVTSVEEAAPVGEILVCRRLRALVATTASGASGYTPSSQVTRTR
jgi:hypothetical protein